MMFAMWFDVYGQFVSNILHWKFELNLKQNQSPEYEFGPSRTKKTFAGVWNILFNFHFSLDWRV